MKNPEEKKPSRPCPICKKNNPILARECVRCGAPLPQKDLWKYYVKSAMAASSNPEEQKQGERHTADNVEPPPATIQSNQPESKYQHIPMGCVGCLVPAPIHFLTVIFEIFMPGIKSSKAQTIVTILFSIFVFVFAVLFSVQKVMKEDIKNCFVNSHDTGKRMQDVLEKYHSEFNKYPGNKMAKKDIVKFLNKYIKDKCIKKNGNKCAEEELIKFDMLCEPITAEYSVAPDGSYYNILIAPGDPNACQICVTNGSIIPDNFIKGGKALTCRIE